MELIKYVELGSILLHLLDWAQKSRFSEKCHLSWDLATLHSQIVRSLSLQQGSCLWDEEEGQKCLTARQGIVKLALLWTRSLSYGGEIASLPLWDGPNPLGTWPCSSHVPIRWGHPSHGPQKAAQPCRHPSWWLLSNLQKRGEPFIIGFPCYILNMQRTMYECSQLPMQVFVPILEAQFICI